MLPKIDVVQYDLELPLTKKKIKFRPFLVKEEKILLMAMESDDDSAMFSAIKQIVNNCCITQIDLEQLPLTDLEYIFLNLRARSIGEEVNLEYRCNNVVKNGDDESVCGNIVKFKVNLLEIVPDVPAKDTRIQLSDNVGVVVKYPTMNSYEDVDVSKSDAESVMEVIINCIECVYDEDNVYYSKDIDRKELVEFIDSLTKQQFDKIQEFFSSVPTVSTKLDFKCSKCGHQQEIEVKGAQNFFA